MEKCSSIVVVIVCAHGILCPFAHIQDEQKAEGSLVGRRTKGRLYKRGSIWWVEYFVNGKRFQESLDTDDAQKAESRRREKLGLLDVRAEQKKIQRMVARLHETADQVEQAELAAQPSIKTDESWQAFLASPQRPDAGQATLRQYKYQWDLFTAWLSQEYPGATSIDLITVTIATEYARWLGGSRKSAGTFNKHIGLCRLVLKVLLYAKEPGRNPFQDIQRKRERQDHRCELPWQTVCKICDDAKGEWKTLIFVGIYTGQRLGDCCMLTWGNVDLAQGWIRFVPQKTQSRSYAPIQLPILPHLRPMLEKTPLAERSGYVLPTIAALYSKSRDRVTDHIQKLLRNCGVQIHKPGTGMQKNPSTGKWEHTGTRAVLQYGFHSLRHTTVSLLQQSGAPLAVVQAIAGHRTVAMTQRYTHVGQQAIASAMSALPSPNYQKRDIDNQTAEERLNRIHQLAGGADAGNWRSILDQIEQISKHPQGTE